MTALLKRISVFILFQFFFFFQKKHQDRCLMKWIILCLNCEIFFKLMNFFILICLGVKWTNSVSSIDWWLFIVFYTLIICTLSLTHLVWRSFILILFLAKQPCFCIPQNAVELLVILKGWNEMQCVLARARRASRFHHLWSCFMYA